MKAVFWARVVGIFILFILLAMNIRLYWNLVALVGFAWLWEFSVIGPLKERHQERRTAELTRLYKESRER